MAVLSAVLTDGVNRWSTPSLSWSSADPGVATVTQAGAVLGMDEGTTAVTATSGLQVATAPVLVVKPSNEDLDPDTSAITGRLFLDEKPKNDLRDPGEPLLALPGAEVFLGLGAAGVPFDPGSYVPTPFNTFTDFGGGFAFREVPWGPHRVRLFQGDPSIPEALTSGAEEGIDVSVGANSAYAVDLPLDIRTQVALVDVFFGKDEPGGTGKPVPGVAVDLYATAEAAVNAIPATRIATATTDAVGRASLRFSRADDAAPSGPGPDYEVHAVVPVLPSPDYVFENNPTVPVLYDPLDSLVLAPDTVLIRTTSIVLGGFLRTGAGGIPGATIEVLFGDTLAPSGSLGGVTDGIGYVNILHSFSLGDLPDTVYLGLGAGGSPSSSFVAPIGVDGEAIGSYLRYVIDGTARDAMLGQLNLRFLETLVSGRVYHETDDLGGLVRFTGGDDHQGAGNASVTLWDLGSGAPVALENGTPDPTGLFQFPNVPAGGIFALTTHSTSAEQQIVSDTLVLLDSKENGVPDGSGPLSEVCPLSLDPAFGPTSCHTFALKYTNGTVQVRISTGSAYATDVPVLCTSPDPASTTPPACRDPDPGSADNGVHVIYHFTNVREGTYWVKIPSGGAPPPTPLLVRVSGNGDVEVVTFS